MLLLPFSLRRGLAAFSLLLAVSACDADEERLRDAWALWLAYEPVCDEPATGDGGPALTARWRRALAGLNVETQAVMEELLAAAAAERSESGRHLALLLGASRELCRATGGEPVPAGVAVAFGAEARPSSPAPSRAREAARRRVAASRSRLERLLPLTEDEAWHRAARYSDRLAAAVSAALEAAVAEPRAELQPEPELASDREGLRSSGDQFGEAAGSASSPVPSRSESTPGAGAAAAPIGVPVPGSRGPDPANDLTSPAAGGEAISIRSTSGRSWSEIRRRRSERAARRMAAWRPVYRQGLTPVLESRRRLARELASESLEALGEPCRRLGLAAEKAPASLVSLAPAADLAAHLAALLEAYAEAGRACARGRPVLAWERLVAGDRHWAAAVETLERIAREPHLPPSLRGRAVAGPGAEGRRVE